MKKYKILVTILLAWTLLFGQTLCAWGAESEWYDLREIENYSDISSDFEEAEITPYTRYIVGASVYITHPSSDKIWMRTEVFCSQTMKKITTVFTLQKKIGSSWTNVGYSTVSVSNDNSMYKSMEATGVSSGTYRCIADTQVTSSSGYTETISAVSGEVKV